jgi:hypothetical protein
MIQETNTTEQANNIFQNTFSALKVSRLLRQAGIRKSKGIPVLEVFKFLVLLVFQGKNLYRFLASFRSKAEFSKNSVYRMLNGQKYNWRRFIHSLSVKVIGFIRPLTGPERVKVLILDDTIIPRNRSKKVELLAKVHDHTSMKFKKGFSLLTVGWSDGYSFVPTDFAMLSSANKTNRYQEINKNIDKRSNGYKRRIESMQRKSDTAVNLIKNSLNQGIEANYVLMDSWFTHEPLIKSCLDEGIDVIGMVKQMKQKYSFQGKRYDLKELRNLLPKCRKGNIIGSMLVSTKSNILVKLVYVKNRNKKRNWLVILSTDCSLSNEEIVRIYGNRWSIEVFFKSAKSLLKLGSEFQGRSYDMMIAHTTIVMTRFILTEWLRREENDQKTFGELFFICCDDIQDMDLITALQNLINFVLDWANEVKSVSVNMVKNQLQQWISRQAAFIKALFSNFCWES